MDFRRLPSEPDHPCFACGHANPHGLRMEFATDGEAVISELRVPGHLRGWSDVVHGGVVSTILDEIMGKAAIYLLQRLVLTRSIQVEFLKPLRIDEAIRAEARLRVRPDERRAIMEAAITGTDGEVRARAGGDYSVFTVSAAKEMGLDEQAIADFEAFMKLCGKR